MSGRQAPSTQSLDPVTYRLSFPEPQHRWMQVEAVFPKVGGAPLDVHMSRSSPGRYAIHEFAKNVYDVRVFNGAEKEIGYEQPDANRWMVKGHDDTVRVVYKVYGDRIDGTYLAVDTTHAHINMPAALMWARGLEGRPVTVVFDLPRGLRWKIATQLYPSDNVWTFTAPNLQYLMDSPVELGGFSLRSFAVPSNVDGRPLAVRLAVHHDASEFDVDTLFADVQKIVREEGLVFGEFPEYETDSYTIIADYVPHAGGDGMEHRNSTVVTSQGSIGNADFRHDNLRTIAHEFFHGWNTERIRPRSLEPFSFADANSSGELWFGEGFTSYYQELIMRRAGLSDMSEMAREAENVINDVLLSSGRRFRTLEQMSLMAVLVDGARPVDRTNWANTYVSYYTWGEAVGLGLDLTLRERSGGRITLDDYMRILWRKHGRPTGGSAPGFVDVPYTMQDLLDRLAEVSGDRAFAEDFFARFIQGHEAVDYARLLRQAGLILRKRSAGRAWLGDLRLDYTNDGARIFDLVPFGSPAYSAGLEQDDVIVYLDDTEIFSAGEVESVLLRHKPHDRIPMRFLSRGSQKTGVVTLEEDPRVELVPVERTGREPTPAERRFRQAWLETRSN